MKDTGHWSFADDCALIADFQDGCGRGTRSSGGASTMFDYLSNDVARQIAARHLVTFFRSQLMVDSPAGLCSPSTPYEVVRSHPALLDGGAMR